MKTRLSRVLCFIMALVMALSFTACTSCKKKPNEPDNNPSQEVSSEITDIADGELSEFPDEEIDIDLLPGGIDDWENMLHMRSS